RRHGRGCWSHASCGSACCSSAIRTCAFRSSAPAFINVRKHLIDLYNITFVAKSFREYAGFLRGDFDVDLIGFELDDRLAYGDSIALVFCPARNSCFGDGVTEWWHFDVDHWTGEYMESAGVYSARTLMRSQQLFT